MMCLSVGWLFNWFIVWLVDLPRCQLARWLVSQLVGELTLSLAQNDNVDVFIQKGFAPASQAGGAALTVPPLAESLLFIGYRPHHSLKLQCEAQEQYYNYICGCGTT